MRAVANSPKFAKKVGVPQSVGREFTKGDDMKGKYKKGGETMKKVASAAVKGHEKRMHGAKKGGMMKMAKGGCATKKMAKGGSYRSSCDGIAQRGKTRAK